MASIPFGETGTDLHHAADERNECCEATSDSTALSISTQPQQNQRRRRQQRKLNLSIDTSSAAGETQLLTLVDDVGGLHSVHDDDNHAMELIDRNVRASVTFDVSHVSPQLAAELGAAAASISENPSQSPVISGSLRSRGGVGGPRNIANAAEVPSPPMSPISAASYSIPDSNSEQQSTHRLRYSPAAIEREIYHMLEDEVSEVGAWASQCRCSATSNLRHVNSLSLVDQTVALFNLASHALLSTGSSCRKNSQDYAEVLTQSQQADFPLSLPKPLPPDEFFKQCDLPMSCSSPTRSCTPTFVTIPIHHLLHHLSLPPHSHPLSLAVLGFCYEFGLTNDVVDIPVELLNGVSLPQPIAHADAAAVTVKQWNNVAVPASPSGSPTRAPLTSSASKLPLPSPKPRPPPTTWRAPTPSFRKAELCYIGASYFPSHFTESLSSLTGDGLSLSGERTLDKAGFSSTPPGTPLPIMTTERAPDHLGLSRLAFLRKYGRPGVRIDRREAEALVAIVNTSCEQLGANVATPVAKQSTLVMEASEHDMADVNHPDNSVARTLFESVFQECENTGGDLGTSCSVVSGDYGITLVDLDLQEAALASWSKKADDERPGQDDRRFHLLRSKESVFVDLPSLDVEYLEQPAPSIIYHPFETDGLTWLTIAATRYAHPASQYALGGCHHEGVGFAKDEERAFSWYHLSAIGGHPRGMGILGYCYIEGFGVEKNDATALKWYQLAALHNDSVAIYNIGYCYEDGIGVEKDPQEAVRWYRASAEQGNAFAQNSLGYCYEDGIGVEKDEIEAIKWYTLSAKQGYPWAECNLGYCYQNGIGVVKDEAAGAMLYHKAARQGHARAQHNLGFCYQNGIGVPQDESRAVYWYTASAEHDNIFAYHSLGYCYQNGIGVHVNEEMAVGWYKKAADEGHAPAQLSLGYCYRNGTGVPVSEDLAVKYFQLSAEQGNALAQNSLGFCYEEGLGVEKNPQLAVEWYLRSAEQGNPWAQCNIGYCYAHGFGVERSPEKAFEWYEKAAHQDHPRAQDKLGACYQSGNGVKQDVERAVYWYRRAAELHGHVGAMFHLARCLEEGVGCEADLEEAVRFYEEAGRAGCRDSQKRMTRILSTWCLAGLSFRFGYCAPCA